MTAGEMRCDHVRSHLPLFVGGDLDRALAHRLRVHLRACHECRREAGAQLQAVRSLRSAACAAVVPGVDEVLFLDLHDRVLAEVASPTGPHPTRTGSTMAGSTMAGPTMAGSAPAVRAVGLLRDRPLLRRAGVAAAACALFVGGWMLARPGGVFTDRGLMERAPIRAADGVAWPVRGAGPPMQQLSHDQWMPRAVPAGWTGGSSGLGLMGRLSLRTLEDEQALMLMPDQPAAADEKTRSVERSTPAPGDARDR